MGHHKILTGARLATMVTGDDYGLIENGALVLSGDRIAWVGPAPELPAHFDGPVRDLAGRLVTPGLIDAHTHIVFAGDRAREFEMRVGIAQRDVSSDKDRPGHHAHKNRRNRIAAPVLARVVTHDRAQTERHN